MRGLKGSAATLLEHVSKVKLRCQAEVHRESTCAGAMVMESPVWTPMGSIFSMEQMMTTLSARSRMTSSSYSFQPSSDFSISTCNSIHLGLC